MIRKILISVLITLVLAIGVFWIRNYSVSHGVDVLWLNGNRLTVSSSFGEVASQYLRFREDFFVWRCRVHVVGLDGHS